MFALKSKNKEDILKLSISVYFFIALLSTTLYAVFFYYTQIYILAKIELLYLAIHVAWIVKAYKENYNNVLQLIPYYFLFVAIFLFPFVLYICKLGLYTGIFWYALIPFGTKLHFCDNNLKGWMFLSVFLIAAIIVFQNFIEFDYALENNQVVIFNICNTIFCCAYMYICFYFIITLSHRRSDTPETPVSIPVYNETVAVVAMPEMPEISEIEPVLEPETKKSEQQVSEKFVSLFKKINEYFENEKPYLDADFSVAKLANDMNSNTNYITRAIKFQTGNNFNRYVNSYRIKYIQQLFVDEKFTSYTIDHLREKSGFKNQSTFNDTFKKQTGMTPSNYLDDLKLKL
ncbi:MAG: AraC family transcriptional regulator [Tannerella sp.]|jgi:AraC-like DNA-binding protein|nr:AraC family transcriptional regulator [Tannerella sp.]